MAMVIAEPTRRTEQARCVQRTASPSAYTGPVYRNAGPALSATRLLCIVLAMFGRALVGILVAAVVLGVPGAADADQDLAVESLVSAAVGQSDPLWAVLLLAALAPALGRRRSRRFVAGLLVVLVGVLAFETALHSVHHGLGDQRMACSTAAVAPHIHGTTAGLLAIDAPILKVCPTPATPEPLVCPLRPVESQHDRSPPSALA